MNSNYNYIFSITDNRFSSLKGGPRTVSISATSHSRWAYIIKKANEGFDRNMRIYYHPEQQIFHVFSPNEVPKGWIKLHIDEIILISNQFFGPKVDSQSLDILSDFYKKLAPKASNSFFSRIVNLFWRSMGGGTTKEIIQEEIKRVKGFQTESKPSSTELNYDQKEREFNTHFEKLKNLCTSLDKITFNFATIRNFSQLQKVFSEWIDEKPHSRGIALHYVFLLKKFNLSHYENKNFHFSKSDYYTGNMGVPPWKEFGTNEQKEISELQRKIFPILMEMKSLNQLIREYPELQQFS